MFRCPGQDQRFWKPEDIFEVNCPGCAQWRQYAERCLGIVKKSGEQIDSSK